MGDVNRSLTLKRNGSPVGSFLGSLGDIRETRLTAAVGFLTSRFPEYFLPALGLRPRRFVVSIEETEEGERFDVLLKEGERPIVIEGKLTHDQTPNQLRRYLRRIRSIHKRRPHLILLDRRVNPRLPLLPREVSRDAWQVSHASWQAISDACRSVSKSRRASQRDPVGSAIAADLSAHLEEFGLVAQNKREVYSRDLGDLVSTQVFFHHWIYTCPAKYFGSATGNLYFAPYFTQAATNLWRDTVVPLTEGISHVARVLDAQKVERSEIRTFLREAGWNDYAQAAARISKYQRGQKEIVVLLLREPFQLFSPPVTKWQLNRVTAFGTGMMGSRSWTFEELIAASKINKDEVRLLD